MTGVESVPKLLPDAVHLWEIDLDAARLPDLLSETERHRAARFHFERDRRRFTTGRSALRILLGGYLKREPRSIVFQFGPAGKPTIPELFFNLAHSGPHGLIGVAADRQVGVDIEEVRPMPDMDDVAQSVFAPAELVRWRNVPEAERVPAFYRLWTRKEAYLKAIGEGIAHRLQKFEVAFEVDRPPVILAGAEGVWTLADVSREPGIAGAVAYEASSMELVRCELGTG